MSLLEWLHRANWSNCVVTWVCVQSFMAIHLMAVETFHTNPRVSSLCRGGTRLSQSKNYQSLWDTSCPVQSVAPIHPINFMAIHCQKSCRSRWEVTNREKSQSCLDLYGEQHPNQYAEFFIYTLWTQIASVISLLLFFFFFDDFHFNCVFFFFIEISSFILQLWGRELRVPRCCIQTCPIRPALEILQLL